MSTTPGNWEAIRVLFEETLELDFPERLPFLLKNCPDPTVRAQVEQLLSENDRAGSLVSVPVLAGPGTRSEPLGGFQPGDLLAGRFKIVHFIAAGGMGEVYEAEDLELREQVAVKTILPGMLRESSAVARFRREVQLARRVTHPNVCRIFDLFRHKPEQGQETETLLVSMELLRGETLVGRLAEHGRVELREALSLVRQIASGLAAAHDLGIVHRDLKPGNVILVGSDLAQARAVVTDFGIALQSFNSDTPTLATLTTLPTERGLFGTPAYMAPEQLEGRPATFSSDVYALGLIIYEVVTGVRPFTETNVSLLYNAILNRQPQAPSRLNRGVPIEFDHLILKAIEKDPAMRYPSARELSADLQQVRSEPLPVAEEPRRGNRPGVSSPHGDGDMDNPAASRRSIEISQPAEASDSKSTRHALSLSCSLLLGALTILLLGLATRFTYNRFVAPGGVSSEKSEPAQAALSYYIVAQDYHERRPSGPAYRISEQQALVRNSGIHLVFSSRKLGYLYILNEGPTSSQEQPRINSLFPSPSTNGASSQLLPGREITIPDGGPLVFDNQQGIEKLWLVWSRARLTELEALKRWTNLKDRGRIGDVAEARKIRSFLSQSASLSPEVSLDSASRTATLASNGDILVHLVRLNHE